MKTQTKVSGLRFKDERGPWTVLDTPEDLEWLTEVHGCDTSDTTLAILHGNEDSPYRVELYRDNDINSPVRICVASEECGEIDSLIVCGY